MKIQILPPARQDLVDGFEFYERQEPGVGQYFLDSLYSDIDSLQVHASIHPKRFANYQRMLSKRFPFAVYYRIEQDILEVHAVLDCRRSPAWIRKKLG